MGVTNRLVFDPTDTGSVADSSSVGAYVRSSDGTLIDHSTINSFEWLNVAAALHDGSGNAITSTGGALDVNLASPLIVDVDLNGIFDGVSNTDPDNVGAIFHVRAGSPTDANQTFRSTGDNPDSDDVNAGDVHAIDTNGFLMAWDGSAWDRITRSADGVEVDIAAISIAGGLEVQDIANTNIVTTATPVSTTAVSVVGSALSDRKFLYLANEGNRVLYLGKTGVLTTTGYPIYPGMQLEFRLGDAIDVKAIGPTGASSEDLRVLEAA